MSKNQTLESINDAIKVNVETASAIKETGNSQNMASEARSLRAEKADLLNAKDDLADKIVMLPDTE